MKQWLFILICFLFCNLTKAQDLVINGNFEAYNSCYDTMADIFIDTSSVVFPGVEAWFKPNYGSSDYLNACNLLVSLGSINPYYSGQGMAGFYSNYNFSNKEFLQTKLSMPMLTGQCYHVELFVSSANFHCANTDNLGMHFGVNRVQNFVSQSLPPNDSYTVLPVVPQVTYPLGNPIDSTWHKMQGIYIATGGERYLTIGSFDSTNNMNFYYFYTPCLSDFTYFFIDDVSVLPIEDYLSRELRDTILCPGASAMFSIDTGYTSILWSNGSTTNSATYDAVGTHWVQVDYGCGLLTHYFDIAHAADYLFANATLALCDNQLPYLVQAQAGYTSYVWNDGYDGADHYLNASGTYICTASNTCTSIVDTITITTLGGPPAINLGNDTTLCSPININLSCPLGYNSYSWSTGSSNASIAATMPGLYSVTAYSTCGVFNDNITISNPPIPILDLGTPIELCEDMLPIILAAPDDCVSYLWSTGSVDASIEILAIGVYSVTCVDVCGIQADTITVTIVPPAIDVDLGPDLEICYQLNENNTVIIKTEYANSQTKFIWNTGDTTKYLITNVPGQYILKGSSLCGTSIDTINLIGCIPQDYDEIFIPNAFSPNKDEINDLFEIYGTGYHVVNFSVYNRWGEKVYESKNDTPKWDGTFKNKLINTGVYNYVCVIETDILKLQKIYKGNITITR
jgi:gliding motility-associated-like protein